MQHQEYAIPISVGSIQQWGGQGIERTARHHAAGSCCRTYGVLDVPAVVPPDIQQPGQFSVLVAALSYGLITFQKIAIAKTVQRCRADVEGVGLMGNFCAQNFETHGLYPVGELGLPNLAELGFGVVPTQGCIAHMAGKLAIKLRHFVHAGFYFWTQFHEHAIDQKIGKAGHLRR